MNTAEYRLHQVNIARAQVRTLYLALTLTPPSPDGCTPRQREAQLTAHFDAIAEQQFTPLEERAIEDDENKRRDIETSLRELFAAIFPDDGTRLTGTRLTAEIVRHTQLRAHTAGNRIKEAVALGIIAKQGRYWVRA